MSHRNALASPGFALFGLVLVALIAFGLACGGGGDDDGGAASEDDVATAANQFLATALGLFTGSSTAQEFIDSFAPECREGVDVASLEFVMTFIQGLAPGLQGKEIEEVDIGPLVIEETAEGTLVTAQDPDQLRVKVDGEFVSADQFFADAGFDAGDSSASEPILLVRQDGRFYIGDCSQLEDLTGGL